ncbi:hypothetical protein C5O78_11715 [Treponema phagedenis]|nr:hypothetical protein C5O78_11715 [Treponema phagedenis]
MMLKSGKLCNQSCFKTSLLHGITTIHARPEIYIPPVQGCRNALHAKHTRNQPCAAAPAIRGLRGSSPLMQRIKRQV